MKYVPAMHKVFWETLYAASVHLPTVISSRNMAWQILYEPMVHDI